MKYDDISGIRSSAPKGLDNARSEFKYLYTNNIGCIGARYSSIDDTRLVANSKKEGSTMVIPRNRGVPATNNYMPCFGKNMVIGNVVLLQKYGVKLI